MTAVAFDTLRFVRTLREKAKMSPEQAEGLADAVSEAIQNDLATKTDIAMVRTDIEALRLSTKTDIEALRLSTKADLREAELRLEARIEATKGEIIKWVIGSIGFQALVIVGAVAALTRGLH
ncbi:CCDC90 family protein [Methylobacterium sp. E-005]|uniref:CCDC90 family protein n=1 Tax=Methylobacterium sp. E-005 TaxID=2836549 RepID=UPI001FBA3AC2|nr:CCDC90 family protein [Methylobacterium sp. E-005]MCJ2085099.1 CCDC90 family protein [Methylobacterium sp. E-005]